jgi:hypothetical protein
MKTVIADVDPEIPWSCSKDGTTSIVEHGTAGIIEYHLMEALAKAACETVGSSFPT